jgi:hypothetical protein
MRGLYGRVCVVVGTLAMFGKFYGVVCLAMYLMRRPCMFYLDFGYNFGFH